MRKASKFLNPSPVVGGPESTQTNRAAGVSRHVCRPWRTSTPEKIVPSRTYRSQFATDWPDSPPEPQPRRAWNTANWRIGPEDPETPTLHPDRQSELPSTKKRLEQIKWTIKRDGDTAEQEPGGPIGSEASSIEAYDWHDPELSRDEQDTQGAADNAGHTLLRDEGAPVGSELAERVVASTISADAVLPSMVQQPPDPYCDPVAIEDITIGVELEFIVTDILPEPMMEVFYSVAQALKPLATKLNTTVLSGELELYLNRSEKLKAFQVHSDLSIRTEYKKGILQQSQNWRTRDPRTAQGVEIATPILKHRQWESVIPEMAQIVRDRFQVAFNDSTGLHVHVGIGRDYRLQDLRRIAKAIVLFETAMNKCHPVCRNPAASKKNSHILACRDSLPLKGLSDIEMMRKLDSVQDIHHLFGMMQSVASPHSSIPYHRGYRYNLTSVEIYNTVEFRQAAGTIDGHKTVEWINRTIKFVTSAIATSDEVFNEWGATGVKNPFIYRWFGVPPPNRNA